MPPIHPKSMKIALPEFRVTPSKVVRSEDSALAIEFVLTATDDSDLTLRAMINRNSRLRNRRAKHARCYASTSDGVDALFVVPLPDVVDFPQYPDLTSIYTSRGDYPDVDRAFDLHNGSTVATQRAFLTLLLPLAMKAFGVTAALGKIAFSNFAGCSCPCSPGFIVEGLSADHSWWIAVQTSDEYVVHLQQEEAAKPTPLDVDAMLAVADARVGV